MRASMASSTASGNFIPGMRKKLYAIILKRIMGSGDDHAGVKIVLPDQTCNSGSCQNSRQGDIHAGIAQTRRKSGGDVRPRFAGIDTDERVRCLMFLVEINAHRRPTRMKSRIIEWRRAGNTPNAVSAKILFCHKGLASRWDRVRQKY